MTTYQSKSSALKEKHGPWAVVTGASDGIGRAYAEALAEKGFNVVLVARRERELEALAAELRTKHHVECKVIPADLSIAAHREAVTHATESHDVGLLVCAAGFGTSGAFVDNSHDDEINMIDVNCAALASLSWTFAKRFVARKRGALVLLSSIVAFQGVARSANYAATKAYVQTLAEGLRVELAPFGVEVLAVAPGPVASGFAARARMHMSRAESPATVAIGSLRALGKRGTTRPGLRSKVLGYSLALTPRWGRVKIMAQVMRGMTMHPPTR
jgi:uncharacterized protein